MRAREKVGGEDDGERGAIPLRVAPRRIYVFPFVIAIFLLNRKPPRARSRALARARREVGRDAGRRCRAAALPPQPRRRDCARAAQCRQLRRFLDRPASWSAVARATAPASHDEQERRAIAMPPPGVTATTAQFTSTLRRSAREPRARPAALAAAAAPELCASGPAGCATRSPPATTCAEREEPRLAVDFCALSAALQQVEADAGPRQVARERAAQLSR